MHFSGAERFADGLDTEEQGVILLIYYDTLSHFLLDSGTIWC